MVIPGIQDFHDGMNQHMAHEIEHALQDVQQQVDSHDHLNHLHQDHLAAHCDHSLNEIEHAHHEQAELHLLDRLIPAAVQGIVTGAVKFAAEMATDAILTQGLMANELSHGNDHRELQLGTSDGDGFVHQTTAFTCAVVSQQMILHQFKLIDPQTGEPISEAKLVYDATSNGWLTDRGTNLEDLSKLLDHYGVDNHEGHDWSHLVHDLAAGHQVVMAVNADHLWTEHGPFSELMSLFGNSPNHAIVVKGLRVDDHGKVMVVVNDPGQADGAGVEYPLEHFQTAVDSTHLHYVATDHAPPDWSALPEIMALSATYEAAGVKFVERGDDRFACEIAHTSAEARESFLRGL